jgi:hypothetical protein
MIFYVDKKEIWIQPVKTEADSMEEAREKILEGDYEITDDPQYSHDEGEMTFLRKEVKSE